MSQLKSLIHDLAPTSGAALIIPGQRERSYFQLKDLFHAMHEHLISIGVQPGDRIGICSVHKSTSIVVMGACLLAEAPYVPLDAYGALSRNQLIVDNCLLQVLCIDPEFSLPFQQDKDFVSKTNFLNLDVLTFKRIVAPVPVPPPDLAFVLNTSGSTGIPKGVMITHQNAYSFIHWAVSKYDFSTSNHFASIAPLHFDLSVFDVFVTLYKHATLILFDAPISKNPLLLTQYTADYSVNVLYATPSLLISMLDYGKMFKYSFETLKFIFFAGEPFPVSKLNVLCSRIPHAKYSNWYGPTETNVVTFFDLNDSKENMYDALPIGKVCHPNLTYIDKDEESLIGELLISGPGVFKGYFNKSELTEKAFKSLNGLTWYCTGDLVSIDPKGDFIFHGRKDRMVKRRGYRIELDEIQHHLSSFPGIHQLAVIAKKMDVGLAIYCIYSSDAPIAMIDLRNYLLLKLPLYMMPDQFLQLETLPLTSSGKIDVQSLLVVI